MLMPVTVSFDAARPLWAAAEKPEQVRLTWMSVTNWLFEVGTTRILLDGYITRIPEAAFSGVGFATATPTTPDEPSIQRLISTSGGYRRTVLSDPRAITVGAERFCRRLRPVNADDRQAERQPLERQA